MTKQKIQAVPQEQPPICPLSFMAGMAWMDEAERKVQLFPCVMEKCAWWDSERCIMIRLRFI